MRRAVVLLLALVSLAPAQDARAQLGFGKGAPTEPIRRDQPAYYQADIASYDRDSGVAILEGHVEFWQDNRLLLADKVTFDRTTNVATATGHVVMLEPDGQTVFADTAELAGGMKDGVLSGMRALLAENGRLAANGMRRTDGHINELSRVVYSTCNLCADDPTKAPLWQIRARTAVQDTEAKMIEYRDAVVDIYGIPVLWTPYLTHPDPSQSRASGLLVPAIGNSSHLGVFYEQPYYWVIDAQSDATITPVIASKTGPAADLQYRRRFNDGTVTVNASVANDNDSPQGHLYAKGQFVIDDTWRWGFDLNRASSIKYTRDFRIPNTAPVLTSTVYLEGFGAGAYSRLDTRAYQSLTSNLNEARLPYVLPRYEYSFFSDPLPLGGRLSVDTGAFNVVRFQGTTTERASLSANWSRNDIGHIGDVWQVTLHMDSALYEAQRYNIEPNWGAHTGVTAAQAMPTAALMLRYPLVRDAGSWGTQIIEPIAQVIAAPRSADYRTITIPNEDSLDFQFTDANLFALNRYPGIDRLEGGMRANLALHANWTTQSGGELDAQVGQAYRLHADNTLPASSGLADTSSDIVSHLSVTPNSYFDFTSRQRFDRNTLQLRFADALASAGPSALRLSAGYIFSTLNPYTLYDQAPAQTVPTKPRDEIALGAATKWGHWHAGVSARRNLQTGRMDTVNASAGYEDECFIFDGMLYRRYTSINGDHGDSTVLFQITLKTVGEFGFHAF